MFVHAPTYMSKPWVGGTPGLLQPIETPARPWSTVTMDFTDLPPSKGETVILVVVNAFSMQAHFVPCKQIPKAKKSWLIYLCNTW